MNRLEQFDHRKPAARILAKPDRAVARLLREEQIAVARTVPEKPAHLLKVFSAYSIFPYEPESTGGQRGVKRTHQVAIMLKRRSVIRCQDRACSWIEVETDGLEPLPPSH